LYGVGLHQLAISTGVIQPSRSYLLDGYKVFPPEIENCYPHLLRLLQSKKIKSTKSKNNRKSDDGVLRSCNSDGEAPLTGNEILFTTCAALTPGDNRRRPGRKETAASFRKSVHNRFAMADEHEFRPLTRAELDVSLDWAQAEGWNPGLGDADCFWQADEAGFLGLFLARRLVASISVVAYDSMSAFLGLYIVAPEFRGRGLGLRLWQAGMAQLGARSVGLDGVVAQQDNYARSGFRLAWRNQRYEGRGGGSEPPGLVPVAAVPFAEIAAYDRGAFAAPRDRFLTCWTGRHEGRAIVEAGRLRGYGVIRRCRVGWKIGPLFADDSESAETLFAGLAAQVLAEPIFLDVPQPNAAAVALAERHGMTPCFETARMYAGGRPDLPLARIFGITTLELG
jgi:ribosomal protein S18 acetylase RimI-like enzyme